MSRRPICDTWLLTRAKLKGGAKYYGAYLGGFPERARALLGCAITDPVLHVCGGMARQYPYAGGFGPADRTLDLDPACEPDFLQDAREQLPCEARFANGTAAPWAGILIDPPYSESDAASYAPGSRAYPKPYQLVRNALAVLPAGRRVGIIHYEVPKLPPHSQLVALVGVFCGMGNRARAFTVFEKLADVADVQAAA